MTVFKDRIRTRMTCLNIGFVNMRPWYFCTQLNSSLLVFFLREPLGNSCPVIVTRSVSSRSSIRPATSNAVTFRWYFCWAAFPWPHGFRKTSCRITRTMVSTWTTFEPKMLCRKHIFLMWRISSHEYSELCSFRSSSAAAMATAPPSGPASMSLVSRASESGCNGMQGVVWPAVTKIIIYSIPWYFTNCSYQQKT